MNVDNEECNDIKYHSIEPDLVVTIPRTRYWFWYLELGFPRIFLAEESSGLDEYHQLDNYIICINYDLDDGESIICDLPA
ncbi:hypothetical protein RUM43_004819 [Polyplax serrata]|uniref:Uncharacterized protein n=1 Tax=Polyplax serrata TaxID=468196 RepID=A0AAN8XM22_POLSC